MQPDDLFERQWALAVMERTLTGLREEFKQRGKREQFDELKSVLMLERGAIDYAALAGLPSYPILFVTVGLMLGLVTLLYARTVDGAGLPLGEALALELKHLETVFMHRDAMEGLSSLLQGRRPEFKPAG